MEQTIPKTNLVVEKPAAKLIAKKTETKTGFSKFMPTRERNRNNSSVGPSWGGRKGN